MTDERERILRAQQNCCRLCLAPDSECIPIFKGFAADKEPLAAKIFTCVNIKVTPIDGLSSCVCHACISYLNSWQSFKNRCVASQSKQMKWQINYNQKLPTSGRESIAAAATVDKLPLPIKDEPKYEYDEDRVRNSSEHEELDPTLFLEGSEQQPKKDHVSVGGTPPPQILASLGLQQTNSMNPFSFLSTELFEDNQPDNKPTLKIEISENTYDSFSETLAMEVKEASCRVCSLKFSTRANARRHERKIHPHLYLNTSLPNISLQVAKPPNPPQASSSASKSKDPITPEMLGIYDYTKPEKYRELLTDDKISFIRLHEDFLIQYQNMTCKCCSKAHTTYKNFMAHMRKKYSALPRNLCFKCLKQNDSKALFISHLKKRNCINLYKVYLSDNTIEKASSPDKKRARELLSNKLYECKICTKTFRLKLEFRTHVYEMHSDSQKKDGLPGQCGFCGLEIDDPFERKRHYNNMDCVVELRCVTCNGKYENQQQFLDHVYAKHLANNNDIVPAPKQFFSRLPQSCKICGQRYNNYNNVLRHMESKHPDQMPETYKCSKCNAGYPRLTNLRDHMMEAHGIKTDRHRHSLPSGDTTSAELSKSSDDNKAYTGRYDYVMKDLMSITNGSVNDDTEDGEESGSPQPKRPKLENDGLKECDICHALFSNNIALANHMRSHTAGDDSKPLDESSEEIKPEPSVSQDTSNPNGSDPGGADQRFRRMRCRICQKRFSSKSSYRRHMLVDHMVKNVQFIKCKVCSAEFAYEKGLKVHMFKVHNTVLKDDMIVKQYECDICFTVYRSDQQLNDHRSSVHAEELRQMEKDNAPEIVPEKSTTEDQPTWYQCRYCKSHFNTNKKLAIHINSHDEFDSNDYSCKDCGNVYSGRKSLWVHRYKKHPPVADPSTCKKCGKLFFDRVMLEHHLPYCTQVDAKFKHRTGDDEDDHDSDDMDDEEQSFNVPEVACSMCGKKFNDHELFAKHIASCVAMEMYTDNPLAAMFDTGGGSPKKSYMEPVNESGDYSCDICAKTFPMLTSLKVHRNWHFRNDSKIPSDGAHKRKRNPLKCDYCSSTFMSSNNLKRHIAELHKSEIADFPEPPKIEPEKYLHCTKCNLKFETRKIWVEHKISDAKVGKPYAPFEWGCDICGQYLSRKERLIHHMMTHIKEKKRRPAATEDNDQNGFESNSQDSELSGHNDAEQDNEEEEDQKPSGDGNDTDSSASSSSSDSDSDSSDNDNEEAEEEHANENEETSADSTTTSTKRFSCDLCQVHFETSQELQRHVTSHFLNGPGSVTLTAIKKETSEDESAVSLEPV